MAQITIYIPNDLEVEVKSMAKSLNISMSKFISKMLEQKVKNEWSTETEDLAGAWNDFPSLEEIRDIKESKREDF